MLLASSAAIAQPAAGISPSIAVQVEGHLADGRPVHLFRIDGPAGIKVRLSDYGAGLVSIILPDREGRPADILVHPAGFGAMLSSTKRYGRAVGRYAGRLSGGFILDGVRFPLRTNDNGVTLHGGDPGLDSALWSGRPFSDRAGSGVEFRLISPDGAQGFPGQLMLSVRYLVARRARRVTISYRATTDRPTVINLTNHSYFNLAGAGSIRCHLLQVDAPAYVETDRRRLPTGRLLAIGGSALDFRRPTMLGERISSHAALIQDVGGLDHMLALAPGGRVHLSDPRSGRTLDLWTDQPGVQIYSSNAFDGTERNDRGDPIRARDGLAIEPQHFPDSPNIPSFPSTTLRPGTTFHSTTVLHFGVEPRPEAPAGDPSCAQHAGD